MAQAAGERAAEIGDADALGAAVGADPHPNDRPLAVGVGGLVGERLVRRQVHDARADGGDFHGLSFNQFKMDNVYEGLKSVAQETPKIFGSALQNPNEYGLEWIAVDGRNAQFAISLRRDNSTLKE